MPHRFFACLLLLCAARALGAGSAPSASVDDPAAFEGIWLGTVIAPNDRAEIAFHFTRAPTGLRVAFSMPAMSVFDADLGPAEFEGQTLVLRSLDTTLSLHDGTLVGTFAIPRLPVVLKPADAMPARAHPAPVPPGLAPVWRTALEGNIWASPVVRDGIVYVGTTAGKVFARSGRDGAAVWTWSGTSPIYGTVLTTANAVLVVDAAFDLVCLDRASGHLRWRTPLDRARPAGRPLRRDETFNHRTPTPVLRDGTLFMGSADGAVYAIEPKDGAVKWRHEVGAPVYATIGVAAGRLWVGAFDGSVVTLDPRTGNELRRAKLPRGVVSTPVVVDDVVVVGCRDYLLYGLDSAKLGEQWRDSFWFSWVESTPAVDGDTLYIGGSDYARISALDPRTGAARWQTNVHGLTWGTPLVTPTTVYAGTHAQRDALIPHEPSIVALDRATGAVRWRISLPPTTDAPRAGVLGSLAWCDGRVIAACFDGTLAAYPP